MKRCIFQTLQRIHEMKNAVMKKYVGRSGMTVSGGNRRFLNMSANVERIHALP